jgi:hypothetical protein
MKRTRIEAEAVAFFQGTAPVFTIQDA